jgi:hypothetical protein
MDDRDSIAPVLVLLESKLLWPGSLPEDLSFWSWSPDTKWVLRPAGCETQIELRTLAWQSKQKNLSRSSSNMLPLIPSSLLG